MQKMRRRPKFSWNTMRRRQDLSNKMRCWLDFWIKSWWILCPKWMKIAFIIAHKRNIAVVLFGTLKVHSFFLTEGSECSLLVVFTSSTVLDRKDMLKEKKAVSPDHQNPQPSIYIHKRTPIRSTFILRFSRSGFFQLSRCPSYTWAHIKYRISLCVCTCVYKHTPTHHPNIRKNREIYKTKLLSLPLPKHSLPRQQQALTMNQLPIPPNPRMQV